MRTYHFNLDEKHRIATLQVREQLPCNVVTLIEVALANAENAIHTRIETRHDGWKDSQLEEMTGWRNELGFRYNREKEKNQKLRAALKHCLNNSPLDPFERGDMINSVLAETNE